MPRSIRESLQSQPLSGLVLSTPHEHIIAHGNIIEGGRANSVIDATTGVVVASCAEEIADETLDSNVVGLATLGAKLAHALAAPPLPRGDLSEHLFDKDAGL